MAPILWLPIMISILYLVSLMLTLVYFMPQENITNFYTNNNSALILYWLW